MPHHPDVSLSALTNECNAYLCVAPFVMLHWRLSAVDSHSAAMETLSCHTVNVRCDDAIQVSENLGPQQQEQQQQQQQTHNCLVSMLVCGWRVEYVPIIESVCLFVSAYRNVLVGAERKKVDAHEGVACNAAHITWRVSRAI